EIQQRQQKIDDFNAIIAAREEIEAGYATLQAAREADHELAEKLLQLRDFDTRQRALENRIREAQAELENEASGYRARIHELERALEQDAAEHLAQVQAEVLSLKSLEILRQQTLEQTTLLGEERADLEATNRALKKDMFDIKDRLDRLEKVEGALCPLCGQPLDEKHRRELVAQLSAEGKRYGDGYRANELRIKTIGEETAAHKQRIAKLDEELRQLQPLMERAGVLQEQVDRTSEAEARLQEERAALEAVEARLESGDFAHDIREQLVAL